LSPKKIDSKKLVARIFEEDSPTRGKDTEMVTQVLASGRHRSHKSFTGINLSHLFSGQFRQGFGGIDIGTSSVKFVLLGHDRGKISIEDVQIERLTKLNPAERREEKEKELQNALMKIASHVKSKTKVGIALNDPSLFAESITVQSNTGKGLKETVQKELSEKHLIDPTASFFDFVPTKTPDTLNNTQDLFVVAAPRELVYRQFGVAQSAGFRVLSVETNALATLFALRRVLQWNQSEKVLFLDIGFQHTNLGILFGGRLVFNRIIPIAGERFTRAVERELRCDFESAEQLKIQHGLKYIQQFRSAASTEGAEGGQVSAALEQEVETLFTEVERSFQFAFKTESGSDTVRFDSVHMLGGGSRLAFLKEYLEKRWESPVRSVDLWKGFSFRERTLDSDFLKESNDSISVALGVALRITEF
jgi:type IV pilus assembly protein PilM